MTDEHSQGTKIVKVGEQPTTLTLHKCKLVIVEGENKGQEIVLDREILRAGAKDDNDLLLKDSTVSRNHFEIYQSKRSFILRDLESTNGTFIDNVRVKEAFLHSGAIVRVGKTEMKFMPVDEKIQIFPSKKNKFGGIVGASLAMRQIFGVLEKIGPTNVTVIIEGQTGVGKEVIARAIHDASRRARKPYVVFDCSAVADNLIESEMFGHEKGAFTGAQTTRTGSFELANTGTVFLDEIGELSIEMQPKLLRVLEQRSVKRVGGDNYKHVDVRVVCATNRNLEEEVKEGNFREDLFFRLSVVRIKIPSLIERRDDIQLLVDHFIESFNRSMEEGDVAITKIEDDAIMMLKNYHWPGNVRELKNAINHAITFSDEGVIKAQDLPDNIKFKASVEPGMAIVDDQLPFKEAKDKWIESFEKDYLIKLLKRNNLNISKAALEGQIDRKSIQRLLKKYELNAKEL